MNRSVLIGIALYAPFSWVQGYTMNAILLKKVQYADDMFWVAMIMLPIINLLASYALFESAQRAANTFKKLAISLQEAVILGYVIGGAFWFGLNLSDQIYWLAIVLIPFGAGTHLWYWYFVLRVKKGLDS